MPLQDTLKALLTLQQLDSQLQRTKRAQAALDTGASAAAHAEAAHDEAQQRRNALHKASADLKDTELKLKTVEDKRKSYQQKLYQGSVTNARELANIEKEIEALGRQRGSLDDAILQLMEAIEHLQEEANVAEEKARESETRHKDTTSIYRSRYDALALEMTELSRRRAEAASQVGDAPLLKRYEDIRAKSGGIGIAKIEDNHCGGCHMALPAGLIKAVKEADSPQTCENCRRLLII